MLEFFANLTNKNFYYLALSMLLSANLAFFAYSHWNWSEGVWSVVTIAAVANIDINYAVTKMWTRLTGTLVGAIYAFLVIHYFDGYPILLCIMLSIGVFSFSLVALQKSAWNYGGLIANVTMFIVLGSAINANYAASAIDRVGQVTFGILLLALVNTLISSIFMKEKPVYRLFFPKVLELFKSLKRLTINLILILTSLKVVIAMLLTLIPWLIFKYPGGFWAPVSCFFILEESVERTKQKGFYRFLSHLLAALFGLISVLALDAHTKLLFIPLSLGFLVCSYVLSLKRTYSTTGNTMAIAIAIMLLAEPDSSIKIIAARFLNVMLGIAVGLFISRYFNDDSYLGRVFKNEDNKKSCAS